MEILNNFWNMLFMENEELTQILIMPFHFIEIILTFYLFSTFLNISYTRKQQIIYVLVFTIESIFTQYIIPGPYNIYFNYVSYFILAYILFRQNLIKTIIIVIMPSAVFALVGTLILKPLLLILNISSTNLQIIPIYRILYLIIMYNFVFLILFFIKFKNIHYKY